VPVIEQERPAEVEETLAPVPEEVQILQRIREKFASGEWRWIQGLLEDGSGYCLAGALGMAGHGLAGGNAGARTAFERLAHQRLRQACGTNIVQWNDDPGRTLDDVLAVLDKAIRGEGKGVHA